MAQAFFTEVGQREPFKAVIQRDFTGPNARIKRIDERLAREHPNLSGVHPAARIATAILAYSFGGLLRAGEDGGEPLATGVAEPELLAAVVGPDLDSITAQAVLKELREQCLFLHYDGVHYVFKTTANVTQVLEDQAVYVKPEEIEAAIEQELRTRLSGRGGAILWPKSSEQIPDREPRFLLAYLPLDWAMQGDAAQRHQARTLFTQHGDRPRLYRNGLGLAVPERSQVEPLRRAMRYVKAIERVREKRLSLNLTTAQMQQLKEREQSEKTAFESALRNLYQCVWLPVAITGELSVDKITLAGRPLQAQGVQERLIELLTQVPPHRLFTSLVPDKIIELMHLGQGEKPTPAIGAGQVVESFYSVLGFPRLESEAVLRRAIAEGIRSGRFGYVAGSAQDEVSRLKEQSGYLLNPGLARIGVELTEQEIDLGSAFLVLPQVIGTEPKGTPVGPEVSAPVTPGETAPPATGGDVTPRAPSERQTAVRLSMRMTRQQIYAGTKALANLADAAGTVHLTVEAQKMEGFDPTWLRNAVLEPLDEADVDVKQGG